MATSSPIELQKHLSGISYPASKKDLVDTARSEGAPEDILKGLEQIPDQEYDGPNAVSKAFSNS
jgi:hypothetical protein